jgi:hypothetical protein
LGVRAITALRPATEAIVVSKGGRRQKPRDEKGKSTDLKMLAPRDHVFLLAL